jgi:hypothetical protein
MTGSAKQSISPRRKYGLLRRVASRNDRLDYKRNFAIPRRDAPEPLMNLSPPLRAWGMPGARCTRSLVCKVLVAHECSHHRSTGTPGIPARNGFNGLFRALPGDRALLPPSSVDKVLSLPGRADKTSANLTPASGRQDHTTSPSAACISRQRAVDRSQISKGNPPCDPSRAKRCRVHRIPPRVRDDRDTPLQRGGMRKVLDVIWVR